MMRSMEPLALYIHWPFCLSKCPYCDFNSHVRDRIDQPRFAAALPEVEIGAGPAELAEMAARLREPVLPPQVDTEHVHVPRVNIREHMLVIVERLQELGTATFQSLCAGCRQTIEVVARFLALLELYREARVAFEQEVPLGELSVRWTPHHD